LHLLDAGCGSAVFSLAVAARDRAARITALDWPAVLGIAREEADKAGLGGRFTAIPGNYHAADLPEGSFDLAIAANVTHLETKEGNLLLFRKLHRALRAGGEIAVIDVFPDGADARLGAALYAFGLALRNRRGRVHSEETLSRQLRETGFAPEPVAPIGAPPHVMGLLLARKSG
jgi:ubiquinone/menaquinone biosynthesis C-methylase UbiE